MDGPPLHQTRLFLVAAQVVGRAAKVVAERQTAYGPPSRTVRAVLDGELLVGRFLLALARHVALLAAGQVTAEVAAQVDGLFVARILLQCPQLLLLQQRCRRVQLEAECLGRQILALVVHQTHLPLQRGRPHAVHSVAVHRVLSSVCVSGFCVSSVRLRCTCMLVNVCGTVITHQLLNY